MPHDLLDATTLLGAAGVLVGLTAMARTFRKPPQAPSAPRRCRECHYEIAAHETLNGVPRRLRRCRACDHRYWEEH